MPFAPSGDIAERGSVGPEDWLIATSARLPVASAAKNLGIEPVALLNP